MIIGNGLLAKAFDSHYINDSNVLVFASGVSNSKETRHEEFLRERQMLIKALCEEKFTIYFSTCSISDPELSDTGYVIHKKEMESLVSSSENYAIFRLPQVVGVTPNPNTLTNYLYQKITSETTFQIWRHAKRNLIDVDDVALIVNCLVQSSRAHNSTINIASPFAISIPQLVNVFEVVLDKKASYTALDIGGTYSIDSSLAATVANQSGVNFDETYNERLIRKYYG